MKAELVPENGDPPIPITKDVTVIGRREYCDVTIDHESLSKRHCVVVRTDGLLIIRDLATTNGTKVKGQKIRWAALLPDDRIAFGAYKLRVYLGPDDLPAPSEQDRTRKPSRQVAPMGPGPGPLPLSRGPDESPSRFPAALPRSDPADDDLEIIGDDADDDGSGWRNLIGSRQEDDDVVIELD